MKQQENIFVSKGVSLTPKQWERCDRLATKQGKRSRNAFIREAIEFYCAWLEKDQDEKFLLPALESVFGAKLQASEERLRRLLFKLSVDMNLLAVLFSREFEGYDDDTLAVLRRDSVRTVSETNGTIRVQDTMR